MCACAMSSSESSLSDDDEGLYQAGGVPAPPPPPAPPAERPPHAVLPPASSLRVWASAASSNFCPVCGSLLVLPDSGDEVSCDVCPYAAPVDSMPMATTRTQSYPKPTPEWLVEWSVLQAAQRGEVADINAAVLAAGGQTAAQRATVQEECPKCKNPTMEVRCGVGSCSLALLGVLFCSGARTFGCATQPLASCCAHPTPSPALSSSTGRCSCVLLTRARPSSSPAPRAHTRSLSTPELIMIALLKSVRVQLTYSGCAVGSRG